MQQISKEVNQSSSTSLSWAWPSLFWPIITMMNTRILAAYVGSGLLYFGIKSEECNLPPQIALLICHSNCCIMLYLFTVICNLYFPAAEPLKCKNGLTF